MIAITAIFGLSALDKQSQAVLMDFFTDATITTDQTIANDEIWTVEGLVILTIDPDVTMTVWEGGTIDNYEIHQLKKLGVEMQQSRYNEDQTEANKT